MRKAIRIYTARNTAIATLIYIMQHGTDLMHVPVSTSPIFWCRKRKRMERKTRKRIERKTRMIKTKRREKQNRMKGMLKDMTETKTKINVTKMIETVIIQIYLNIAVTPAVIVRKRYASLMLRR